MNETFNHLENFLDLFTIQEGKKLYPAYVIVYVVIYSVSTVIGTCGHITIITVTLFSKQLRNNRNAFIINLSIADLFVSTIVMPASILGVLQGRKWYEEKYILCYFTSTICAPTCIASLYSIAFIAISRYYYIAKFQRYTELFTCKKTIFYICIIWLIGLSVHVPNHFGWGQVRYTFILRYCSLDADQYSYAMFYASALSLAITISFVFYLKIYLVIRRSVLAKSIITGRKKAKRNFHKSESEYEKFITTETTGSSTTTNVMDEIKILKSTFKIFILFVVCWSPACVLLMLSLGDKIPPWAYLYAAMLSHCNSTMNFSAYFFGNDLFRKSLRECVFRKSKYFETSRHALTTTNVYRKKSKQENRCRRNSL